MRTKYEATITFAKKEQAVIFQNEIVGQLSDGAWENSKPYNHWEFWSDVKIQVGAKIGVSGRIPYNQKRGYNLMTLIDGEICDLSERMRAYVAAYRSGLNDSTGWDAAEYLVGAGSYEKFVAKMERNDASYAPDKKYWVRYVNAIPAERASTIFAEFAKYSRAELIRDIRAIKEAMKTDTDKAPTTPVQPELPVQGPVDEKFEEFKKENRFNSYEIEVDGKKFITCEKPTAIKARYPKCKFTGWTGPVKPKVKLSGQNGNIFNLGGIATSALKQAGQGDTAKKMQEEIFNSGSYDNALQVIMKYCDVE